MLPSLGDAHGFACVKSGSGVHVNTETRKAGANLFMVSWIPY